MFWLLYFSKPTAMLRGHNAPIFYLFIANDENRVFSLSTDKCIKVSILNSDFTWIDLLRWAYCKYVYLQLDLLLVCKHAALSLLGVGHFRSQLSADGETQGSQDPRWPSGLSLLQRR